MAVITYCLTNTAMAEGQGEGDEMDHALRNDCVAACAANLHRPHLTPLPLGEAAFRGNRRDPRRF